MGCKLRHPDLESRLTFVWQQLLIQTTRWPVHTRRTLASRLHFQFANDSFCLMVTLNSFESPVSLSVLAALLMIS